VDIDLQSEHERYLTEKYAKEPVNVMNYPKGHQSLYMRVNDYGRRSRRWAGAGNRRDHSAATSGFDKNLTDRGRLALRRQHGSPHL
jgi:hypothetical protein